MAMMGLSHRYNHLKHLISHPNTTYGFLQLTDSEKRLLYSFQRLLANERCVKSRNQTHIFNIPQAIKNASLTLKTAFAITC
jgi:hypothetical protein